MACPYSTQIQISYDHQSPEEGADLTFLQLKTQAIQRFQGLPPH